MVGPLTGVCRRFHESSIVRESRSTVSVAQTLVYVSNSPSSRPLFQGNYEVFCLFCLVFFSFLPLLFSFKPFKMRPTWAKGCLAALNCGSVSLHQSFRSSLVPWPPLCCRCSSSAPPPQWVQPRTSGSGTPYLVQVRLAMTCL